MENQIQFFTVIALSPLFSTSLASQSNMTNQKSAISQEQQRRLNILC